MSDPPYMGTGLAEFVEGREFDVYIEFMNHDLHEIFRDPLNVKLTRLLKEPGYQQFFDDEDRQCTSTLDGQTFRMAVKYVLPSLLHSMVLHFKTYPQVHRESEADKMDLKNVEFYLKTDVANTIKSLMIPPNPQIEKPAQLRRNKPDQLSNVQRRIVGWIGEEIGFTCNEFIREGKLLKKSVRSTIYGASFGRSTTTRHKGREICKGCHVDFHFKIASSPDIRKPHIDSTGFEKFQREDGRTWLMNDLDNHVNVEVKQPENLVEIYVFSSV